MKIAITLLTGLLLMGDSAIADEATDYFTRSIQKAKKNDYRGAVADFTKAIDLKPDYAEAYNATAVHNPRPQLDALTHF